MTIPNILTLIRMCLVPIYLILFYCEDTHLVAAVVFVLASLTDVADGYLARKLNASTKWGQLMDPLADKCMQVAVILSLFTAKLVPIWFILLLIVKEVTMIAGSIFLYSKKTYVKANKVGKLNTVFLFLVMTLLLFFPTMPVVLKNILLGCSATLTLLAAVSYIYLYFVYNNRFKKYTAEGKKGETV